MKSLAVLFLATLLGLAVAAPAFAAAVTSPGTVVKPPPEKVMPRPVFNVSGIVQGEDGKGIAGVAVTVGGLTATSGTDGSYAITSVPMGNHTLSAAKAGYTTYSAPLSVTAAVVKNITLTGAYTLSGYVRDPSGVPVPGVIVTVAPDGKQGTAGADGSYSVGGLTVDRKAVRVYLSAEKQAAGQLAIPRLDLDFTGNMTKDFTVSVPQTWTLKGFIRDAATGSPVAGVTITVDGTQTTTSKADGSYSLSGIRIYMSAATGIPRDNYATVSKAGYNTFQGVVYASKPDRDFGLTAAGAAGQTYTLSGYVRDPSGVPVPGVIVTVAPDGKQGATGADGSYSVGGLTVDRKSVRVYLSAEKQAAGQLAIPRLDLDFTGNMTKDFTVSVPQTWTLKGFIRDAATGSPVAGVTITVDGTQTTTSKADGSYSLSGIRIYMSATMGIPKDNYATVSKAGYNTIKEVVARERPDRDFGLTAAGAAGQTYTLSGYVRDSSGVPMPGVIVAVAPDGKQGTAGADGRYSVGGLTVGQKEVRVYLSAEKQAAGQLAIPVLVGLDYTGNMTKDFAVSDPHTWTLKGFIRDAATGAPVAGATITVDGKQTTTSKADGSYSLSGIRIYMSAATGIPRDNYATVSKAGYNIFQGVVYASKPDRDFGLIPQ